MDARGMKTLDHGIGDLQGDTKFSPYQKKELREQMLLTRDAVHGELLKSIRAIDVMRGIVVDALQHSPPRTQAESIRRQKQAELMAQRRLAGASLSSRNSSPPSASASASPSSSRRHHHHHASSSSSPQSPPSANRGVHSPRVAGSPYYHNQHQHCHNSSSSSSPSMRTPRSLGGAGVGAIIPGSATATTTRRSPSPPQTSPGCDPMHSSSVTTVADRSMKTDGQLPFEGIAVCRMQLEQSLDILRGKPPGAAVDASFTAVPMAKPPPSFAAIREGSSQRQQMPSSSSTNNNPPSPSQPALLHRKIEHVNTGLE